MNDELGRKVPKARLVILGYQDPDLDDLERESPTLSTTSRSLTFTIAYALDQHSQSTFNMVIYTFTFYQIHITG